jgi:TPR repeat protein
MFSLGDIYDTRKEHEQGFKWYSKSAETGLPKAMYTIGVCLDKGEGVSAMDHPAAAGWYRRAADAGVGEAAFSLSGMYTVGRGRAWQTMLASSSLLPSFLEFNGIPCSGEHYLPGPTARRHT